MNRNRKTICIYCSSSIDLAEKYYKFGQELGSAIAKNGYNMVYGGTTIGLMGAIADNALKSGAEVTGVIPECIASLGLKNPESAQIIITKDIRERKAEMERLSDIFVAAPGGFGTFEEIFEIISSKQLGCHNKPVIFMNFDNYYDDMFKMFDNVYKKHFAKEDMKSLYYVADTISRLFDYIKSNSAS